MPQRTWLYFNDFQSANVKLYGLTGAALRVVEDNLPVREQVHLVATAEVTDIFGDTYDGVLVLTDAALYIAHADNSTNQAYASWVDRNDQTALDRLRDRDNKAMYRTTGFSGQNIAISVDSADRLEQLLFGPPEPTPEHTPPTPPVAALEPVPVAAPVEAPKPTVAIPEPVEQVEVWIGAKTKEKFVKKAMSLIAMNLRAGEVLHGLAEVNTEILVLTNQRAFTMKTYGNPVPLVSLIREEMRDVTFEGSGTKISIQTSAGVSVQLCKTYTMEDVPRILEFIRRIIPDAASTASLPAGLNTQKSAPAEVLYWGKFKDKEFEVAKQFIAISSLPGEHVIAMLNTITRWTVLTNMRVLLFKVVAPRKLEEVVALDQLAQVSITDKLSGSLPILETRAGMKVELDKGSQREDVQAMVNVIRQHLSG